jgi:hypothetical protein
MQVPDSLWFIVIFAICPCNIPSHRSCDIFVWHDIPHLSYIHLSLFAPCFVEFVCFTYLHYKINWLCINREDWIDLIWFIVFNATLSNISVTSFSAGRSRSTRREPPTIGKQLVNFITCAASKVHLFCNLQCRARTHAALVIGLYELLDPTT